MAITAKAVIDGLHIGKSSIEPSKHTTFHPGRSAALQINNLYIGDFGELHPRVAQILGFDDTPVMIAELDLDALIVATPDLYAVEALPTAPPVLQDIAFVISESTPAAELEAAIWKAGGKLLRPKRGGFFNFQRQGT